MSDKSTQEFFPLLNAQKDPLLISSTHGYDQQTLQRRQRYVTLTQHYIGNEISTDDNLRTEYLSMERNVLKDFLEHNEAYQELSQLILKVPRDVATINTLVEKIRETVAEKNILPATRYSLLPIIRSSQEFDKSIKELKAGSKQENPQIVDSLPFSFPEIPSVHISKLYHWTPTEYIEDILQRGLLPGVCTAKASGNIHPYIYATLMQNDFWGRQLSYESSKAKESDIPFTQLEIDYHTDMETCMRLPIIQIASTGKRFLGEPWIDISSRLISLDRMVSAFIIYDKLQLETVRSNHKQYIGHEYDLEEWIDSSLVGEKIPPDALLSPYNYTFNEVKLTGYIAPENIRVIK